MSKDSLYTGVELLNKARNLAFFNNPITLIY